MWLFIPLLIAGFLFAGYGLIWLFQTGFLRSLKPRTIDQIREGLAVVQGKVKAQKPLTAPVSGEKCVYYYYELRGQSDSYKLKGNSLRKSGSNENVTCLGESRVAFSLIDKTGSVTVHPDRAVVDVNATNKYEVKDEKMLDDLREKLASSSFGNLINSGLSKVGETMEIRSRDRVIFEYLLKDGDKVSVIGASVRNTGGDTAYLIKKGGLGTWFKITNEGMNGFIRITRMQILGTTSFGLLLIGLGLFAMSR
jgi:hypothetical protein